MKQQSEQYHLLKAVIDKELEEIDEEMSTQDNSDISTVVAFHIEHGVRDVEQRIADNGQTELEFPYGTPDKLIASMNQLLLHVEALFQYYYRACYFGSGEEQEQYRQEIMDQLESLRHKL